MKKQEEPSDIKWENQYENPLKLGTKKLLGFCIVAFASINVFSYVYYLKQKEFKDLELIPETKHCIDTVFQYNDKLPFLIDMAAR